MTSNFITIPDDILYHIISNYLNFKDILGLSQTCKHFNQKLNNNSIHDIWKDLYLRDISSSPIDKDYRMIYINAFSEYLKLERLDSKIHYLTKNNYDKLLTIYAQTIPKPHIKNPVFRVIG